MRQRADVLLVERGLFSSRAQARAAIEAGRVFADGAPVTKPSMSIGVDARLEAEAAHPWVSRAGLKLASALEVFGIDPAGRTCLDIGASTGGFCDVVLTGAAAHVTAVDVGRDQLHARIRGDARIAMFEGLDARDITQTHLPEPPSLITCDASFIGLEKVLRTALTLAAPEADLIALFKPQFEVGPDRVGKGGIVRDMEAASKALTRVSAWLSGVGWPVRATAPSPIAGAGGNQETLVWARSTL